ncbi:MAG: class I SAM-dependent methyltransferase [Chloroflexi bacterium]|nr:class I SAM-dependent methyltransferase [Chloroflexota bacterium]
MSEQPLPFLVAPYSALAGVYNRSGLSDYARQGFPRYITYAQSINWAGFRMLDLGCGTGASTWVGAEQGYRLVGIDNNPHMIEQARAYISSQDETTGHLTFDAPSFEEMDIRQLESPIGEVDMVLAIGGVMNTMQSLRELETSFVRVHQVLGEGKLFMFDMRTIRGLANEIGDGDTVRYDNGENLTVVVRSQFSYETLTSTRHYIILTRSEEGEWLRRDEIHLERGYPTQGIMAVLERNNFQVVSVLTPEMRPFDVQHDMSGRAVFVAQKR